MSLVWRSGCCRYVGFPLGETSSERGVAGRPVPLASTRSSACHPEVKGMSLGAERSRLVGNARGADTPGAFGVLAYDATVATRFGS